jgi:uncharacterized protein (TIGR02594 family)
MAKPPRWLTYAKTLIGVREIVGPKHSPTIMGWIKALGAKVLGINVTDDETPWCGTFVAHVMQTMAIKPPAVAVRASSWATWGRALVGPRPGCVLVFTRTGGGHVGLYVGEGVVTLGGKKVEAYRVLGGNQSNAVNETWIAKDRLAPGGLRWPLNEPLPPVERVVLTAAGSLSENEA